MPKKKLAPTPKNVAKALRAKRLPWEAIAEIFHVSSRTVVYWLEGKREPSRLACSWAERLALGGPEVEAEIKRLREKYPDGRGKWERIYEDLDEVEMEGEDEGEDEGPGPAPSAPST